MQISILHSFLRQGDTMMISLFERKVYS